MISGFVRKTPLIAALIFIACGKDTSGPTAVATSVAVATNVATTAIAGSVVAPALTFSVKDQNGNTMSGVPVTVTVTGGGTIAGAPTTTSAGDTPVGTWTLGNTVSVNTLTVKAAELAPVAFTITTVAGPPAQLIVVSGGGQVVTAGSTITGITVKVVDKFLNGVANQPVTLSVTKDPAFVSLIDSGGRVTPTSGTTDAAGALSGISWTVSRSAIQQNLSVVSGAFTGLVTASIASSYSLEVRYYGSGGAEPSPTIKGAFDKAAARIRGAITGTLGLVRFDTVAIGDPGKPNTNCGVSGVVLNETIRDVVIFAQIHKIDGVGKILGAAGPCLIRNTSKLTIIGVMEFDSDDLDNIATSNRLEAVILHEMSHVLGFGTLWDQVKPIPGQATTLISGEGGTDPRFTGEKALSSCLAAGGTTLCSGGVAVENCIGITGCGGGTQDSHWREGNGSVPGFRNESMTGYVAGFGVLMPYSDITIQSLADLGYTVNSQAADPYSVPNPSLRAAVQADGPVGAQTKWESVRLPIAKVSKNGVVTRIERQ